MLLNIVHQTSYRYDQLLPYALQRVRLQPRSDSLQTILEWSLDQEGAIEEVQFDDQYGNRTRLLSLAPDSSAITVTARGRVKTHDRNGVAGAHTGLAPLWLFQRESPLTAPSAELRSLAVDFDGADNRLETLHSIMAAVADKVAYEVGTTTPATGAAEAFSSGSGVCQDHAHIFISLCRSRSIPARYVSGYLLMDGTTDQVASHAWAEAYVDDLGWVGFDVSNGISPDERYVRIAIGCDYRDANPISGIRRGMAHEELEVHISVEQ